MQIEMARRAKYQLHKGLPVLLLSLHEGEQERPVLCRLHAGVVLELTGSWLRAPSMSTVQCDGQVYAAFTEDLEERGVRIGECETGDNTAILLDLRQRH
jgi:hypothetical protein